MRLVPAVQVLHCLQNSYSVKIVLNFENSCSTYTCLCSEKKRGVKTAYRSPDFLGGTESKDQTVVLTGNNVCLLCWQSSWSAMVLTTFIYLLHICCSLTKYKAPSELGRIIHLGKSYRHAFSTVFVFFRPPQEGTFPQGNDAYTWRAVLVWIRDIILMVCFPL